MKEEIEYSIKLDCDQALTSISIDNIGISLSQNNRTLFFLHEEMEIVIEKYNKYKSMEKDLNGEKS